MAYHSAIYISSIENLLIAKLRNLYLCFINNLKIITNLFFDFSKENTLENFYTNKPISIFKKESYLFIILFHFSKLIFFKIESSS